VSWKRATISSSSVTRSPRPEDDPFAVEFRGGLLKDHTLRQ
jgi:hypothetical protein